MARCSGVDVAADAAAAAAAVVAEFPRSVSSPTPRSSRSRLEGFCTNKHSGDS